MKSEYAKVPGWKAWYDSRKPSAEEAVLLKGTNALRTRLTKQEALQTTARIQLGGVKLSKADYERVNSLLRLAPAGRVPIQLGGSTGTYHLEIEIEGEKLVLPATEVYFDRRLKEFPDLNILDLCQRYYETPWPRW